MIFLIIGCFITGISLLYFLKFKKTSTYLLFSFPVGVSINSVLFFILSMFKIVYSKYLFLFISIISLILLIICIIKKRNKIIFDLNNYSIFYFIIIGLVLYKLIIITNTSYFDFYNTDEFTAYIKYSNLFNEVHHFGAFKNYFAPLMYFIGTITYDLNNSFDLSLVRTVTPIFYILISFFIYYCLSEEKVNKYLAALISLIFILASSENMVLAKTFYTNIYFSFYIISGTYLFLKNFKEKNNYTVLSILLLFSASLIRREGIYVLIAIMCFGALLLFIKNKKITKCSMLILLIPFCCYGLIYSFNCLTPSLPAIYQPIKKDYVEITYDKSELFKQKTSKEDMNSFFVNLYDQTLSDNWYFYNRVVFIAFIISIPIYIVYMIIFKKKELLYLSGIFYVELVYLAILAYTFLFLFKEDEFMLAASFSRYVLAFMPLNFIIIGICLFRNTRKEKIKQEEKELKKYKNPKVLLVIPAYNEEKCILDTYNKIINYNKKNKTNYDVIVINDGSKDMTGEICNENKIPHVSLVCNLGIGGAVQTGYKYAYDNNYDIVVQYDADGQHDINYINKIIKPIIDGKANMVIGSRFVEKDQENFKSTFLRRVGINLISFTIKLCTGKRIFDTTSGFRAIDRSILELWKDCYPYEYPEPITNFELLKNNYNVDEVHVVMHERVAGKSSIHAWKSAYYMINVIMTIIIKNIWRD